MLALTQWLTKTHAVDLALVFMATEAGVLLAYRWRLERGPAVGDVLSVLIPGACLLLALRAALSAAGPATIMALLLMALLAHLYDLQRRWGYP
jgi:hypothetical protein